MDWRGHKKYKKKKERPQILLRSTKNQNARTSFFFMRRLTPAESLARRGKRRAIEDRTPEPPKSSPNVMFTWAGLKNGNEVGFAVNACTQGVKSGVPNRSLLFLLQIPSECTFRKRPSPLEITTTSRIPLSSASAPHRPPDVHRELSTDPFRG